MDIVSECGTLITADPAHNQQWILVLSCLQACIAAHKKMQLTLQEVREWLWFATVNSPQRSKNANQKKDIKWYRFRRQAALHSIAIIFNKLALILSSGESWLLKQSEWINETVNSSDLHQFITLQTAVQLYWSQRERGRCSGAESSAALQSSGWGRTRVMDTVMRTFLFTNASARHTHTNTHTHNLHLHYTVPVSLVPSFIDNWFQGVLKNKAEIS